MLACDNWLSAALRRPCSRSRASCNSEVLSLLAGEAWAWAWAMWWAGFGRVGVAGGGTEDEVGGGVGAAGALVLLLVVVGVALLRRYGRREVRVARRLW